MGSRIPLVAFKREAFGMFNELIASIRADIVRRFFRVQIQDPLEEETVLTRHRDREAALPAESVDRPPAVRRAGATNGSGQAPRLSRRQRRAQERARKKRERRRSRQRVH